MHFVSLGLLYIASFLRNNGCRVVLIDCLNPSPPDMVFVTSMMTYWYPGVFEVIRIVNELLPDAPVVLGGNYATICPDHASLSGADFILDSYPYPAGEKILPMRCTCH